ncbi:MAG: nitroreductase family protein [Lachnospiraceae bacterium]|nr:nitroreductase family protein [Lachnospiraceae bacterium]
MTPSECIRTRRSIRHFTEQPIPHDVLSDIIETASYAPSWKHTQITRYIAVENLELKNKIADKCTAMYQNNGEIIKRSSMLIAITIIKNRSGYERDGSFSTPKGSGWQMYDAGIATEAFCVAAWEKGIGSVILGLFDEAKATALLEIPEERELVALVAIGYPAEEPVAPKRKPVEELLVIK